MDTLRRRGYTPAHSDRPTGGPRLYVPRTRPLDIDPAVVQWNRALTFAALPADLRSDGRLDDGELAIARQIVRLVDPASLADRPVARATLGTIAHLVGITPWDCWIGLRRLVRFRCLSTGDVPLDPCPDDLWAPTPCRWFPLWSIDVDAIEGGSDRA